MKICVTFPQLPIIEDNLIINRKLGCGKFPVYEAHSPKQRESFALKVFPRSKAGATQYQKEKLMLKLCHPNIIQSIPMKCHRNDFFGLLTELVNNGDFFELVTSGCLSTETIIRTYFHQLIKGLEYSHSQGVAHLDLKLENLMAGSDYTLKIIDFDQAQPITDIEISSAGSTGYRAPEVQDGTCSNMSAADIYSAGIVLYAFFAQEFPFVEMEDPSFTDPRCYGTFVKNNARFWRKKAEGKKNLEFFSPEFIELINGMLHINPQKRFKIKDIKNSKWFQGPTHDKETLKNQMTMNVDVINRRKRRVAMMNKFAKAATTKEL